MSSRNISPAKICCVHGCNSVRSKSSLYKFPPTDLLVDGRRIFREWIHTLKLPKKFSRKMRICRLHFTDEDFEKDRTLKRNAVPTVNLPLVWRNKFYPRDYGKLIKVLEYRGIGRLRLCFEAKLSRRLKKTDKKHWRTIQTALKKRRKYRSKCEQTADKNKDDCVIVSSSFSLSSSSGPPAEPGLTSEIEIKDEPMSDAEEQPNREETIEEMLARMNEDSNDFDPKNVDKAPGFGTQNMDSDDSLCNVCGDFDCQGHGQDLTCRLCGDKFKKWPDLRSHKLNHALHCKSCSVSFSNRESLGEHVRTVHPSLAKPYVCMLCDEAFKTKLSLMQHVSTHTIGTDYRCRFCREYLETQDELDSHVFAHGITRKRYICRQCGQKFRSKVDCWDHLNVHRERIKTSLECDVCGRFLSSKTTLKEHMFIHSGEKPFECQLCGRKIRHRANFILHVEGHSLGRLFTCEICGMGYGKKSDLNTHVSTEHPEDRPYQCTICGSGFRSETRFLKHAISHDAHLEE